MNDRINNLWEEAKVMLVEWRLSPKMAKKIPSIMEEDHFIREKFAELIVGECVEQIYPQWIKDHNHINSANLADAVMRVKEHFGVRE